MRYMDNDDEPEQAEQDEASFRLMTDPKNMLHLDIVWQLVLETENADVIPKAVRFLIHCYMSITD